MRVLVVEDDAKVSRMLARGLGEEGYEIVCVGEAESALARLRQERFDVCVLDVLLPAMDGFEALARARAQGIVTPILLLTARDRAPKSGERGRAEVPERSQAISAPSCRRFQRCPASALSVPATSRAGRLCPTTTTARRRGRRRRR